MKTNNRVDLTQGAASRRRLATRTAVASLALANHHNIAPQTEHYPMTNINVAYARRESGKARHRIVLDDDFWPLNQISTIPTK